METKIAINLCLKKHENLLQCEMLKIITGIMDTITINRIIGVTMAKHLQNMIITLNIPRLNHGIPINMIKTIKDHIKTMNRTNIMILNIKIMMKIEMVIMMINMKMIISNMQGVYKQR